jgi:hypothetical protein
VIRYPRVAVTLFSHPGLSSVYKNVWASGPVMAGSLRTATNVHIVGEELRRGSLHNLVSEDYRDQPSGVSLRPSNRCAGSPAVPWRRGVEAMLS